MKLSSELHTCCLLFLAIGVCTAVLDLKGEGFPILAAIFHVGSRLAKMIEERIE